MKILKTSLKIIVSLLVLWTLYANLGTKPMHAYAPSAVLVVMDIPSLSYSVDSIAISENLNGQEGISAFAINRNIKRISIMYHDKITSKEKILNMLKSTKHQFVDSDFGPTDTSLPQCPVPADWILAFENWKYAFCFR